MNEQRTSQADWVVPAIMVGVGFSLILVIGLLIGVTSTGRVEASGLVHDLDVYTTCLADHGANVPLVEARRDGGFSVIVPGTLVDGEIDTAAWRAAHDQCSAVAPDLFGGLVGSLSGGLLGGLMDDFPDVTPHDI